MARVKIVDGGASNNAYFDTQEFRDRWHSDETIQSIADSQGRTVSSIWHAARRRGFPSKNWIKNRRRIER